MGLCLCRDPRWLASGRTFAMQLSTFRDWIRYGRSDDAWEQWSTVFGGVPASQIAKCQVPNANGSVSELHCDRFALCRLRDVEELALLDVEHSSHDVSGKCLDLGIEIAHHGIVVSPRVLDGIFQSSQ